MKGVLLLSLILSVGNALVLDTANSSSIPAHDFRQLVDLLVEEKHLRSQLENRVNFLEQEIHKNVAKLDAFNRAFLKESSNRHQLELEYARLSLNFRNLSIDHNALIARNEELEKGFLNLTRISQDKINSMEISITDVNDSLRQDLTNEISRIQVLNKSFNGYTNDNMNKFISIGYNLSSIRTHVLANSGKIATNQVNIFHNQADIHRLKQKSNAYRSDVFSASNCKAGPSSGTIAFSNIHTNAGGHYISSTGKFTCQHPGYYFFVAHIVKSTTVSQAYCYIRLNGISKLIIDADSGSGADTSYNVGSNSIILYLSRGDIVNLGECSDIGSIYCPETTFTGFLLSAD